MKIRWFFPGLLGFLCVTAPVYVIAPAMAGELASWHFDQTANSLEFMTDAGVQPRAQLVPDPTRLVIDLPGTSIGEVQQSQSLSGAFRQVRIGQWDANTTRIVVELAPGYMLDPQQVQFHGISPTQWTVQLPSPYYTGVEASAAIESSPDPTASFSNSPASHSSAGYSSASHSSASHSSASHSSITSHSSTASPAVTTLPPLSAPAARSPRESFNNSTSSSTGNSTGNSISNSIDNPTHNSIPASSSSPVTDDSMTQIEEMQITDDGLFLRTVGATPEIDDVDRSRDRRSITVTIENAVLSPELMQDRAIEQFGVEQIAFKQILDDDDDPPAVEITLEVERDSPNWNASVSGLGGIVLLPRERVARRSNRDSNPNSDSSSSSDPDSRSSEMRPISQDTRLAESPTLSQTVSDLPVATIEGIELDPSGTQLLIRSDRPITFAGRWQSGMYQVRLSPAQLAEQVTGPQLDSSSPLLRVRLRQEDDETVVVMIQPASGVRFGALNSVSPQLLSLEMERSTATAVSTSSTSTTTPTSQQNDAPSLANSVFSNAFSNARIPNGRIVVVIDPGHGGVDVGAVGVGDIHEADVVLPIAQQVGALLQQQGIQVVMTRNDDREIDLEPRVQMAEQANATLFVSIHANSMGMDRPDVNGTETYYYSSGSGLAQVIQDNIISAVGTNDRGIKQARFYVLRRTTMPAVLVETGYVTGSEDGPRLADSNFRSQMAQGIARGILQYIRSMASH